ncbi:hypothetical protein [Streptomyces sp. SAJ15]|uniref:hypothetical protein n=1 Tax=Streptomyces sp. SAJ15 TaxID=2011095 RepID=UPI001185C45B|nr:hypothetical protein [Streptomyces sp. SAJ15]
MYDGAGCESLLEAAAVEAMGPRGVVDAGLDIADHRGHVDRGKSRELGAELTVLGAELMQLCGVDRFRVEPLRQTIPLGLQGYDRRLGRVQRTSEVITGPPQAPVLIAKIGQRVGCPALP